VSQGGKAPPREIFDMSKLGELFLKYGTLLDSPTYKAEFANRWKNDFDQKIKNWSPEERKKYAGLASGVLYG